MVFDVTIRLAASNVRARKTRFGSVTIMAPSPSAAMVQHHVKASTEALERLAKRAAKPGVLLRAKKDVPLYSLDSDNPDVMIRKLNGKTERGRFINDVFEVND